MAQESWHNEYMKIPFRERGRTRAGVDCWGGPCVIYKEKLNVDLPTLDQYKTVLDKKVIPKIIEEESKRAWEDVPKGSERIYDLVVLKTRGVAAHIGVVVRPGFMIHWQLGNGAIGTHYRTDPRWCNRVIGFCRYVG